jgi:hypothetical protein
MALPFSSLYPSDGLFPSAGSQWEDSNLELKSLTAITIVFSLSENMSVEYCSGLVPPKTTLSTLTENTTVEHYNGFTRLAA